MSEHDSIREAMAVEIQPGSSKTAAGHAQITSTRRRGDDEVLVRNRAAGLTISQAADAAGLSERQARRRLHEPDLAARVVGLRTDRRAENLALLERLAPKAVERLDELLDSPNPSVQLGAVRTVLIVGAQLYERVEIDARVRSLEEMARERQAGPSSPPDGWPS